MKGLLWWWPTQDRLNEVLISDAEAHSPAVALAVHQQMHILRRRYNESIDTRNAESVDEFTLLARLVEPVGDGCQIILIEGKSGTGKSHVVRWIEIKLGRRTDHETRVVLPVSKGSRLRDIVKKLCDRPELGGVEHSDMRHQLSRAQEPIEEEDAAARLCNQLAYVCEQRAKDATAKLERGQALTALEQLQRKWGGQTQLPHILVYQPLRPLLIGENAPMRRLVQHLHGKLGPLDLRTEQEFAESDLEFEKVPDDLDRKALVVIHNLSAPDARGEAARVLNDALDDAKRILLGLNPGVVQEVFASIRRSLFAQGRELVLLVEDFADLSGIQKEVLQASIETGMAGGVKTQCTLRTVLAFTDGFIHKEQTVLSRAQHVYYVPSDLEDDHVIEQTIRLVGSYLRAARIGARELEKAMDEAASGENWLPAPPIQGAEESQILRAFDESEGIPLFPFSRRVVERLVRDHYYEGAQSLLFVPRDIIKEIMPRLLHHRQAFERGEFPTDAFQPHHAATLTTDQGEWLRRTNATGTMYGRLERFVLYWGLNAGAARAFGLPEPDVSEPQELIGSRRPLKASARGQGTKDDGEAISSVGSSQKPTAELFARERSIFESWRKDSIPGPADRRDIRNSIDESIRAAVAWAWSPRIEKSALFKKPKRWAKWQEALDIDGLRLADDVKTPVTLVTVDDRADKLKNESIARQLTAVLGAAHSSFKSWDVDGIETHLAAYVSFVEQHRPAVEQHLLSTWHSRQWEVVPSLVNALVIAGAVLGVPNSGSSDDEEFINALFAVPPEDSNTDWSQKWLKPLRPLHQALCELLEQEVGAFQGTGVTVHGIDAARLRPLVPRSKSAAVELPALPDFPPGAHSDKDIQTVQSVNELLREIERHSLTEIDTRHAVVERIQAFLGQDVDKDALLLAFDSLIAELKQLHTLTDEDANEIKMTLAALRKERVVDSLRATARLVDSNASFWERLVSIGRNERHASPLSKTARLVELLDEFLNKQERLIGDHDAVDPLHEAEKAHTAQLVRVRELIDVPIAVELKETAP